MDEKTVVKTIRAILLPEKNGLPLRHIIKEFRELVGTMIPYQQFGYNSLDQFLEGSNEFYFLQTLDGPKVIAKENERSAHVSIYFSIWLSVGIEITHFEPKKFIYFIFSLIHFHLI